MAVKQGADAIVVENCAGILAGVAVRAPGHGAGNALDGERGKCRGKRIAAGGAGFFDSSLDGIDGIIGIGSKLIGGSAVGFLILFNEALNIFGGVIGSEGGEHQNIVGNGGILL